MNIIHMPPPLRHRCFMRKLNRAESQWISTVQLTEKMGDINLFMSSTTSTFVARGIPPVKRPDIAMTIADEQLASELLMKPLEGSSSKSPPIGRAGRAYYSAGNMRPAPAPGVEFLQA
ncbi:uncharacterized protein RCO7_08604 [Rhynchosporium graminicola]|uniref:Uncharacterized protein n=1 Tax=Rhynchosporium graminicola TaxID=2792576 RepID=A0A1E1JX40_9HELO|nr:uncharacterized protein RCO7_08604 [Rhynchosporium commune]